MFFVNELNQFLILFLSLTILSNGSLHPCPHKDLLLPCICEQLNSFRVIRCGGSEIIDLLNVFHKLSSNIPLSVKNFDIFYLNNTAIKTLHAHVFQNITFRHVFFDGTVQLEYVHPNAFLGTEFQVESIFAWNTHLESYRVPNDNDGFSRLLNVIQLDIWNSDMQCPPEDALNPCRCEIIENNIGINGIAMRDEYVIHCDSDDAYYIRQVFQRITAEEPSCALHFDTLTIDNSQWTNFTEIPKDAFADVTFSKILLQKCHDCNRFQLFVHPMAFGKSAPFIQHLELSTGISSDSNQLRDTFVAINSLPNLRNVTINSGFNVLRAYSFRKVSASGHGQNKLKIIKITGGVIHTIESYPFFVLPQLNKIDLSSNAITRIAKHAFAFRDPSPDVITIDLSDNPLKSSSFEAGAFSRALRPIKLILSSNVSDAQCTDEFEYLNEDIFAPFLACDGNILEIGHCALKCDSCEMKWLLEVPHHWRSKIIGGERKSVDDDSEIIAKIRKIIGDDRKFIGKIFCRNGKSFFDDFSIEDFNHCQTDDCDKLLQSLNNTNINNNNNIHRNVICKRNRN